MNDLIRIDQSFFSVFGLDVHHHLFVMSLTRNLYLHGLIGIDLCLIRLFVLVQISSEMFVFLRPLARHSTLAVHPRFALVNVDHVLFNLEIVISFFILNFFKLIFGLKQCGC